MIQTVPKIRVMSVSSWLATSKFQPSDARKAFPNFDEPRFKSTFKLTQKHWNNFTALSNMPVEVRLCVVVSVRTMIIVIVIKHHFVL
jgi:hypothetical protein